MNAIAEGERQMTDLCGRIIAQHQVQERLGRGGHGDVYKAFHPQLSVFHAIKTIRPEISDKQGFRESFQRDAEAVASVRHPGIVQIHDFGKQDGVFFMVTDFIDGTDLAEHIRRHGRLSLRESLRLVGKVATALDTAHRRGIVHRDIKPSNIMLTTDGHAILTDFGIGRMRTSDAPPLPRPQIHVLIGTPPYMSPDYATGLDHVGPDADIYSLGVVLYELLTGEVPFAPDTPLDVVLRQMRDPFPSPRKANPEIPPAIEGAILKATAKNPEDRYAKATDFAAELNRLATA